jgi:flagellar assembly protein FliH
MMMREPSFTVQKYRFDRVFTSLEPERGEAGKADLAARAAILQAELDLMRDERDRAIALARAEGYEAGLADARTERETATLAAVDALQAAIEEFDQGLEELGKASRADAAELALAAAELIAAQVIENVPGKAVDEAITRGLRQVARGTHLNVRVSPELRPEIERLVAERIAGERRALSIQVFSDATLAPGDALIGWDEGGLSLDAAARRAAIAEELEPLLRPS